MLAPRWQRTTPRRRSRNAWGFNSGARTLGRGDARNVDGIGIKDESKRGLSASWQQCDVVECNSVRWNSGSGRPSPRLSVLPVKNPPERVAQAGDKRWKPNPVSRRRGRAHTTYRVAGFSYEIPQTIGRAACRSFSQLQSWRPPGVES